MVEVIKSLWTLWTHRKQADGKARNAVQVYCIVFAQWIQYWKERRREGKSRGIADLENKISVKMHCSPLSDHLHDTPSSWPGHSFQSRFLQGLKIQPFAPTRERLANETILNINLKSNLFMRYSIYAYSNLRASIYPIIFLTLLKDYV